MLSSSLVHEKFSISKENKRKQKAVKNSNKNQNRKKMTKKEFIAKTNSKDYTDATQIIKYPGGELWKTSTLLMGNIK